MLISVITDKSNQLVKTIDGDLQQTTPGHLYDGQIEVLDLDAVTFADLVPTLTQNQCLSMGVYEGFALNTPKTIKVNPKRDEISRSKKHLFFPLGVPSWVIFDFDGTGLEPAEAIEAVADVDPRLKECPCVVVPSSSSYIYTQDGKELKGAGNFHVYFAMEIEDEEYFDDFFKRMMLQVQCKPMVTKAGSVVMRSLVDKSVWSPEREIFAAPPIFKDGLYTTREQHIQYSDEGEAVVADRRLKLSEEEEVQLRLLVEETRASVNGDAAKARKAYQWKRAQIRAQGKGSTAEEELEDMKDQSITYDRHGRPIYELLSTDVIYDNNSQTFAVADLLWTPMKFDGVKLPDPHEPFTRGNEEKEEVGRGVATALVRDDGSIFIYSHAHAGQMYMIRWDPDHVIDLLETVDTTSKESIEHLHRLWKRLSTGKQELALKTEDAQVSEIADLFKTKLKGQKSVPAEKRKLESRLKAKALPQKEQEEEIPWLLELNSRYGMVNFAGKAAIVEEVYNSELQMYEPAFTTPHTLNTVLANRRTLVRDLRGGVMDCSIYKAWEMDEERNSYDGVIFRPTADKFRKPGEKPIIKQGGEYNLWQGYIVDRSRAKSCDKILWHIKHVWCDGSETYYRYTIKWLAELFQHPERKCGTALVLRSAQGAGKNIIIDNIIVKILGTHALSTANRDDFVGRFNKHMGWNVFTFANEAFWAGDKSDKSAIKALTTDGERMIEQKGYDRIKAKSYTKLIFASNDQWVINLDLDDRRFVYLPVSNSKVGDKKYFEELMSEIENGGKEAFLDYMFSIDDKLNLNVPPKEEEKINDIKAEDIIASASPALKFVNALFGDEDEIDLFDVEQYEHLYEVLREWRDVMPMSASDFKELKLLKTDLFELFCYYCDKMQMSRKHITMQSFYLALKQDGVYMPSCPDKNPVREYLLIRGGQSRMDNKPKTVVYLRPYQLTDNWINMAVKVKQRQ